MESAHLKKYEKLKSQYPAYVSPPQLCHICNITKKILTTLITNDIITPIFIDGKSERYKISIDEVITYLRRREQWGSNIPKGGFGTKNKSGRVRRSFSKVVEPGQFHLVADYFKETYRNSPDVLSTYEVGEMTGLSKKTIMRIGLEGHIKYLVLGRRYIVPKAYFLEFVSSERFIYAYSNSVQFLELLDGFIIWQTKE